MIVYLKHYEQLCNRIWAFLPALSRSLHHGERIVMLWGFRKYLDMFPNLRAYGKLCSLFEHDRFQNRRAVERFWKWYDRHLVTRKPYREISRWRPVIFADAWGTRKDEAFILEQKEAIVRLFTPASELCEEVRRQLTVDGEVVRVGVHIRRGDYATFAGGKYFFELDYYYCLMDNVHRQLTAQGREVQFVLCSNDRFDIADPALLEGKSFAARHLRRLDPATALADLYALSLCDYLMGPPSTFSQWASFCGGGRLCFIEGNGLLGLPLARFKAVKLLDRFYDEQ